MKWKLEKRKITELKEYGKNPRQLSKKQAEHLEQSLERFGQCEPIVINTCGTIIGGHQRIRTLRKLKAKEVDVYVPEETLSEKQVEELNIRLNKNVGDWDFDILANCWDTEDLLKWGFDAPELGLDIEEVESADKPKDESLKCELCGQKLKTK
jgi:ParB-like chromosome segregation protein Spo0J